MMGSRAASSLGWQGSPVIAAVLLMAFGGCSSDPLMGNNPEAYKVVDGLWTAVTSRRLELLNHCENEVKRLASERTIDEPLTKFFDDTIAAARAGEWDSARTKLKSFIRTQGRRSSAPQ